MKKKEWRFPAARFTTSSRVLYATHTPTSLLREPRRHSASYLSRLVTQLSSSPLLVNGEIEAKRRETRLSVPVALLLNADHNWHTAQLVMVPLQERDL
jgi:hypothetical protein